MLNDICSSCQSFVAIALEPKTSYNIVGSCCVRLHVPKSLTGFKLFATTELPTTRNRLCKRTQHLTSNSVGSCWPTMLRGFRHTSSFEKSYFNKKSFIRLDALIIEHTVYIFCQFSWNKVNEWLRREKNGEVKRNFPASSS